MNEDYTKTFPTALYQQHRDAFPKRNQSYLYPVVYNKTHGCTHLFSKRVFEEVGLFDEKWLVAHDFEFYYRAFAKFPHLYIDEVLVTARESSSRQGRRSHTRGNIEYSLLYINILEHLSEDEIFEIAPSMEVFLLDMEYFFSYADYSIAMDYVEVLAEGKGIKTIHGRRKLNGVSVQVEEAAFSAESEGKPPRQVSRYNFPVRLVRAVKRHGLLGVFRIFSVRCRANLSKAQR